MLQNIVTIASVGRVVWRPQVLTFVDEYKHAHAYTYIRKHMYVSIAIVFVVCIESLENS